MNQQQQQSSDGSLDIIWIMVLAGVLLAVIWYFGKDYIITFVLGVRIVEIAAIQYVLAFWSKIASFLGLPLPNQLTLMQWSAYARTAQTSTVSFTDLLKISDYVGSYIRYPVGVILLLMVCGVYFSSITEKFKTTFSMNLLRDLEKENWPQIVPVCKLDLVKTDIDEGPWAMSMTPMRFAKQYKLLKEEMKKGKPTVTVIPGAARRAFTMQLGKAFTSPDHMQPHVKALFGVFAARAAAERDVAAKVLVQISKSGGSGKLDLSDALALYHKQKNNKYARRIMSRHAYVSTLMASMLELARSDGVIAVSEFLWLKPVDRHLWYVLCNVGRQTAFSEVAGVFAHWLAEKEVGRPLFIPVVDQAVIALELAIADIKYVPEQKQ